MEAAASLGLACNVLQLVNSTYTVFDVAKQIYETGSTERHAELELKTKDFKTANAKVKSWSRMRSRSSGVLTQHDEVYVTILNTLTVD